MTDTEVMQAAYQRGVNDGYAMAVTEEVLEIQQIKQLELQQAREEFQNAVSKVRG